MNSREDRLSDLYKRESTYRIDEDMQNRFKNVNTEELDFNICE